MAMTPIMTPIERTMSMGSAQFGHNLAMGQEAAANGDGLDFSYMQDDEDDRREDIEQDFPQTIPLSNPQATQMDDEYAETEEGEEELNKMKAELSEKFSSLTAKTFRMKELLMHKMEAGKVESPYDMIDAMRTKLGEQEKGEQFNRDAQVFNAICAIFQETRRNEDLRGWLAGLFACQHEYYKAKNIRQSARKEFDILQNMYNEQEVETEMAKLKARQEARMAVLTSKNEEKAKRKAEKALAKEGEKKAKA